MQEILQFALASSGELKPQVIEKIDPQNGGTTKSMTYDGAKASSQCSGHHYVPFKNNDLSGAEPPTAVSAGTAGQSADTMKQRLYGLQRSGYEPIFDIRHGEARKSAPRLFRRRLRGRGNAR